MKDHYPEYKKEGITAEALYNKLKDNEKEIIDNFIKNCSTSAAERKLKDIKVNILQFRDIIEKPLDKITHEDLINFLSALKKSNRTKWTTNGAKTHVKKFLRWQYSDWPIRFHNFNDIKFSNGFNSEKINEDSLITEVELNKLIEKADNYRDKAFIITLYETGARPQEIRELKWKDFRLKDGDLSELNLFSSKTDKSRKVYIDKAAIILEDWRQHYSFPDRTEHDLIFPSPRDRKLPISKNYADYLLNALGEKAGIKRKIYPYLLRHTRATELYKKLPAVVAQKALGHGANMSNIYAHLSSEDLKNAMENTIYKVQKITKEQQNKYDKEINLLKSQLNKNDIKNNEMRNIVDNLKKAFDQMEMTLRKSNLEFAQAENKLLKSIIKTSGKPSK